MKWARSNSCWLSRQLTIWARASAPVMKNSSASGRCRAQVGQGVDRVGRAAAVDVDPADREPRVGRRGDDRHEVAVLGRADLALGLLPRLTGRHEDDLVEPEQPGDLAGGDEVAVVDGIERPTHDPDPATCHRPSLSGPTGAGPVRTGSGRRIRRRPTLEPGARTPPRPAPPCSRSQSGPAPSRTDGAGAAERTGTALTNGASPGSVTHRHRKSPWTVRTRAVRTAGTASAGRRVDASTTSTRRQVDRRP